jgi:hypothetical protein
MEAMKVDNNQKLLPNFELLSCNVVSLMLWDSYEHNFFDYGLIIYFIFYSLPIFSCNFVMPWFWLQRFHYGDNHDASLS